MYTVRDIAQIVSISLSNVQVILKKTVNGRKISVWTSFVNKWSKEETGWNCENTPPKLFPEYEQSKIS
jgi:hypothetical protein